MKSNRCPSPPLLETLFSPLPLLFSSPFASPSSFLYPLSFLGLDFLPPLSAPFFFSSFIFPSSLPLLSHSLRSYSTSVSTLASIRLFPRVFFLSFWTLFYFLALTSFFSLLPFSLFSFFFFLFCFSICLYSECSASDSLERASRKKTRRQREREREKRREKRGRGHANPLHAAQVNGRCTEPANTLFPSRNFWIVPRC